MAGSGVGANAPIPSPYIVRLKFVGPVVSLNSVYLPVLDRKAEFFVYSTGEAPPPTGGAMDTVPALADLKQVQWRRPSAPASAAPLTVAPEYRVVGSAAGGPQQALVPGVNTIVLQVPPQIGTGEVRVMVFVDFAPGPWWAGPDPAAFPPSSDGDGRAVDVSDWSRFTTSPAWPPDGRGYFGPDSFRAVPSQRRPVRGDLDRRTFYEIFGDRIYARAEGDTVHQDSWVVLVNGGFDRDSKYAPAVNPADPGVPAGYASNPDAYSVLIPQDLIGSPSAFRFGVRIQLPDGNVLVTSTTAAYPNFDPFSVFRSPHVAGYLRAQWPGKVYASVQAVDAELVGGPAPGDVIGIADRVDAGGGTPEERLLRRGILTFHVRPAPAGGAASLALR